MSSAIVAEGISKSFGDVEALKNLELDIPEGVVLRAARAVGRGQDDDAARDRRAREARHRAACS